MTKRIRALLFGQLVSQIGDRVYLLALSWWVMETTRSAAQMGVVLAAATVATVVAGFLVGSLADRWNRKRILIVTDVARGAVIAAVGIGIHLHVLTVPMAVASQIIVAGLGALFNTTVAAIIPQLVDEQHLSRANARMATIFSTASIVGPILGGVLASRFGYESLVYLNAATFIIGAVSTGVIVYRYERPVASGNVLAEVRQGYAYLLSNRRLVALLGMVVVLHAFVGSVGVAVPILGTVLPGNYAGNLGLLQTALGVGSVAMALFFSVISIRQREKFVLLMSIIGVGVGYVLIAALLGHDLLNRWLLCVLLAAMSGLLILASNCFETYLQANVDNSMMGRVFGVVSSCGTSTIALSVLCFGAAAERFQLPAVLAVFGVLMSLSAATLLIGSLSGKPSLKKVDNLGIMS